METAWNFQAGLRQAYHELSAEGKLTGEEKQVVGEIAHARRGIRWIQNIRIHRAVRREYCRQQGRRIFGAINWKGMVDWLKENWIHVLKIILSLAVFVI